MTWSLSEGNKKQQERKIREVQRAKWIEDNLEDERETAMAEIKILIISITDQ